MQKLTKEGALTLSRTLDRIANALMTHGAQLGLPPKMAKDFTHKMDIIADLIDRKVGVAKQALTEDDPVKEPGFDPDTIGKEVGGPLEGDADEPYMKGEFSQQENRELRGDQEGGQLGTSPVPAPRGPTPGKQAGFAAIGRAAASARLASLSEKLKVASNDRPTLAAPMLHLAAALMSLQAQIAGGTANAQTVQNALVASTKMLPILAKGDETKVAQGLKLASKIATAA